MATYSIAGTVPKEVSDELCAYSTFLQTLLYRRGIETARQASAFLNPSYDEHLHDPFLLHDMEAAVVRVMNALQAQETIAVYSDYDCDGIPGAVVLHDFLTAIGYEKFITYIPHRHFEGFGLSESAVEKLAEKEVSLIITVDCGTSDLSAVARARALGVDVIITDHHEPGTALPEAAAVVNPKIGDSYPFSGLCGSGVAYKLVQALIKRNQLEPHFVFKQGWEKWSLDMVAVATIADMVPLVDENRALAYYGLQVLRKSRRPGLQQLLYKQRANMAHLTEEDIGFTIGPRINAASRMDTPEHAFLMLSCSNEGEAGAYVSHLEKLNNERRGIVASMTKEAHKRLETLPELPPLIVMGNPQWRPSLVGLVANKLAEQYKRPAFLWGRDGNGVIKGSCRSDGTVSVVTLMHEVSPLLAEHGGHHFSGGFSVEEEHIHTFASALTEAFTRMGQAARFEDVAEVDLMLSLDEITSSFIKEQSLLAPFGLGNPKPLYLFKQVSPLEVTSFGKAKEHTKLMFETKGLAKEAIAFFTQPSGFKKVPHVLEPVDLYAHVEQSYFMGRLQTRLRIVDLV